MKHKYHYTYKITDLDTNKFYIGVRSCDCKPEDDVKYLGSSKTFKPKNYRKEILCSFPSRRDANIAEMGLIRMNISNPLNENRHIPGKNGNKLYMIDLSKL